MNGRKLKGFLIIVGVAVVALTLLTWEMFLE